MKQREYDSLLLNFGQLLKVDTDSESDVKLNHLGILMMSNFISSASDRKRKINNYTIQHNETKSIDRLSYMLEPHMSNNVNIKVRQIEQASNVTKSMTTEKACTTGHRRNHIL